jgi:serine/threonine protein kinase
VSKRWNEGTLIGLRLGSCTLERPLGAGGAGAVYLARQERPRRQVAVKVLHPRLAADPHAWSVFLARFRREADATAGLDHANIVPLYEFGELDDLAYLVMPYLADGSLADLLAEVGALPLDRTVAYLAQTAAALDYAHAHGIIHRDVKPSNLLLHPDGRLLLADFGIAYSLGVAGRTLTGRTAARLDASLLDDAALTHAGMLLGTPQYMAPEQIRGGAVSAATDVYALGILAYTMLAGEPPFGGSTVEVLQQQLTQPATSLAALRPDIPPQVDDAITWALAKRPTDRPATAGAFAQALEEVTPGRVPSMQVGRGSSATGTLPLPQAPDRYPRRAITPRAVGRDLAGSGSHGGVGTFPARFTGPLADDAPTLYSAGMASASQGATSSDPPMWPLAPARQGGHSEPRSGAGGGWRLLALAMVAVIVLGLALLGPGLLVNVAAWQSLIADGQTSGPVIPLAAATATATAAPSPTPVANWLAVEPASVNLACAPGTKSLRVVLQNLGPEDISWTADVPLLGGVSLTPSSGKVPAGGTFVLTISNTSVFIAHSGTIIISASNWQAGQPATLSYTTRPCRK